MSFDYSSADVDKNTLGDGYVFDDAYLKNIASWGNLAPDWDWIRTRRFFFPEPRLNYQLFFLKHPELPYVRDSGPELLKIASRYFDEEAYAFRVSETPIQYPVYDFFKIKEPLPYRRPASNGFLIGTSLAPKRLEAQLKAVETWLCQGFDVLSVNYPDEIKILRPLFPEVWFIPNTRDSQGYYSRKLVYLDDIFQALNAKAGLYEGFGLINSDISLFELDLGELKRTCRAAAVFSVRMDLPERQAVCPGLDAFFMNAEALAHCCARSTNYMLGAPVWDYYLPALLLASGVRLLKAIPPLCNHIDHPIGYNREDWLKLFEEEFRFFFQENVQKMPLWDKIKLEGLLTDLVPPEIFSDLIRYIFMTSPGHINLVHLESEAESNFGSCSMSSFSVAIKPAAILGNGPSLKGFDFQNNLCGYATFGMNAAYRWWDRIHWYPDYYSCLDTVVGLSHKDEIRRLIKRSEEYGIRGFLLRGNLIEDLCLDDNYSKVTNFDQIQQAHPTLFTDKHITTGSHTLAWAAYLGYRDIVLLGVDANYVPVIEGARQTGITLEMIRTPEANPNYFFDDYQRQGDRYHIPNVQSDSDKATHIRAWRDLKAPLRHYGVCVVNANPDSMVDAFPKCRFEDIHSVLEREKSRESLRWGDTPPKAVTITISPGYTATLQKAEERLRGQEVYFWGMGDIYRRQKKLFAHTRPRCILVDMERNGLPNSVDGIPVRHPQEVLSSGDILPIVIFVQNINAVYTTIQEQYPAYTDLVFVPY